MSDTQLPFDMDHATPSDFVKLVALKAGKVRKLEEELDEVKAHLKVAKLEFDHAVGSLENYAHGQLNFSFDQP